MGEEIYFQLIKLFRRKKEIALATVIETEGSAPQIAGASAVFSSEGLLEGTVGGGIVEAEVQKRALQANKKGKPYLLALNLSGDMYSDEGAVCGGRMKILIDPLPQEHIRAIQNMKQSLSGRQKGFLATLIIKKGRSRENYSLSRFWLPEKRSYEELQKAHALDNQDKIRRAFMENKPRLVKMQRKKASKAGGESWLYLEPHFPLPQLVIAGAGHLGQAVARLGKFLSFEVIVIDDRPDFACRERFPDIDRLIVGNIGKSVERFPMASDTYVVIATRGHNHDEEALRACVKSPAGYIGVVGSLRKAKLMRHRFMKMRWAAPADFDRVHTPIGVKIGSKTVEEIAVSIAAELVLVRCLNLEKRFVEEKN